MLVFVVHFIARDVLLLWILLDRSRSVSKKQCTHMVMLNAADPLAFYLLYYYPFTLFNAISSPNDYGFATKNSNHCALGN